MAYILGITSNRLFKWNVPYHAPNYVMIYTNVMTRVIMLVHPICNIAGIRCLISFNVGRFYFSQFSIKKTVLWSHLNVSIKVILAVTIPETQWYTKSKLCCFHSLETTLKQHYDITATLMTVFWLCVPCRNVYYHSTLGKI